MSEAHIDAICSLQRRAAGGAPEVIHARDLLFRRPASDIRGRDAAEGTIDLDYEWGGMAVAFLGTKSRGGARTQSAGRRLHVISMRCVRCDLAWGLRGATGPIVQRDRYPGPFFRRTSLSFPGRCFHCGIAAERLVRRIGSEISERFQYVAPHRSLIKWWGPFDGPVFASRFRTIVSVVFHTALPANYDVHVHSRAQAAEDSRAL